MAIGMWASNIHFLGILCPCISVSFTLYLSFSVGASYAAMCMMVLLELYKPTYGDGATPGDISMPTDGYCFYHCFLHVLSNGAAELTETAAMRFRTKVVARLRDRGQLTQAKRLLKSGSAGYPGEREFAAIADEAGLSFAIVQDGIRDPLVYGSEHGHVRLTVRRHFVGDGNGHESPHYDIISYEASRYLIVRGAHRH